MAYRIYKDHYLISAVNEALFDKGEPCWIMDTETGQRINGQYDAERDVFIVKNTQKVSKNVPITEVQEFQDIQHDGVLRLSYLDTKEGRAKGYVEAKVMDNNNGVKKGRIVKVWFNAEGHVEKWEDSDTPFQVREI